MAEASIPVDLWNPGQVFACLGFIEAAEVLCGETASTFDWANAGDARFVLRAGGSDHPISAVLRFLSEAEVVAQAPHDSANPDRWNSGWGSVERLGAEATYPFPDPASPATLRAELRAGDMRLVIDHWGDATCRDNVKFWAGSAGYPGSALTRDALDLVQANAIDAVADPFALRAPQSSSFRFDWRRDYIPIDAGFSLNAHGGKIEAVGYPLVEVLAAIGLGIARPRREKKLEYIYGVIGRHRANDDALYPASLMRAALGAVKLPFPNRQFRMFLGWPGQEGQARAITTVTEENFS